jgi:predicted NAD/FAD-binding protein
MSRHTKPAQRFGRRSALKGIAGLSAGTLVGCALPDASSDTAAGTSGLTGRRRVAIIGAGAGGLAAAYFLDGTYDVDVFEARDRIGGNADSRTVPYKGQSVVVDLGPQFFTPGTHPTYVTLLEELGLYNPDQPDGDQVVEAAGSLTVLPAQGGWPTLASTMPLLTPRYVLELPIFTMAARNAVLGNMPWETSLADFIDGLPVSEGFRADVLRPWQSALIGAAPSLALTASARSLLQTYALAFPENVFAGATTLNSKIGLQGNLQKLLDATLAVNVRLSTAVRGLAFDGETWSVQTASGASEGPYDAVIVNAPAHTSKELLRDVDTASDLVAQLEQFQYFDARIVIHTDPAYVHASKLFWSAYNASVDGAECEGSVWLAPFHDKLPNGKTVDVFKSWAMHRRADPRSILAERRFVHPLFTPASLPAIRALNALQGRDGLYFSGAHYTSFDLQESAVYSAAKVARALAPESRTLAALDRRMAARGRTGISYEF